MRFACRMTKNTDTLKMCNSYCFSTAAVANVNSPQYCIVRAFPVLLCLCLLSLLMAACTSGFKIQAFVASLGYSLFYAAY
jgi:ribose/xylose/arabinose/galactoside ABC-type transport system permease subunit